MRLYLAVVATDYTTYAIADSEAKARRLALSSAKKWLESRGVKYKSLAEVEEWLGCNIHAIDHNSAVQES
jgi:hypothetical protein